MKTDPGSLKADARGAVAVAEAIPEAEALARSAYYLAKADGSAGRIDRDIALILDTIKGHLQLKKSLAADDVSSERRLAVANEVFAGKVSPAALSFLESVVALGKADMLSEIAVELDRLIQTKERNVLAEVVTAIPLDAEFEHSLAKKLSALTGKEIKLRHKVDESILGGVVIRVGGKLLDGSLKQRFDALRDSMRASEVKGGR